MAARLYTSSGCTRSTAEIRLPWSSRSPRISLTSPSSCLSWRTRGFCWPRTSPQTSYPCAVRYSARYDPSWPVMPVISARRDRTASQVRWPAEPAGDTAYVAAAYRHPAPAGTSLTDRLVPAAPTSTPSTGLGRKDAHVASDNVAASRVSGSASAGTPRPACDEEADLRDHSDRCTYRRPAAPGSAALLPEQAALRRSGHLPASRLPRAGGTRAPRRGLLRPAVSGAGARAAAPDAAEPGPVSRRGPVPHAPAQRDQGLGRPARSLHDVDRRLPRAAYLQHQGAARAARPARRFRHRARQSGAGLRHARDTPSRPAARDPHPPSDQRGPPDRARAGQRGLEDNQATLVLVRQDAGPRRPAGRADHDRLGVVPR